MDILPVLLLFCLSLALVEAAPTASAGVTALTAEQVSVLTPFTQFSRAAYCGINAIRDWSCGQACRANSDFEPSLVGGDGDALPFFFVGFSPSQSAIIVGHQGTDPTALEAILTDLNLAKSPLDSALFSGISGDVQVHTGFRDVHAKTAKGVLDEVRKLMNDKGTSNIITTGHSLGGALAALDALFLKLNIPEATISSVTFGLPRIGNPEFVTLFDSTITNFKRVNHGHDVIPIIPGRSLGFAHPKGEIRVIDDNNVVACSGNDNAVDALCQIASVPTIFSGNVLDHLGPYQGILIGTIFCF